MTTWLLQLSLSLAFMATLTLAITDSEKTTLTSLGKLAITESGTDNFVMTANGIPHHNTGSFPNADNPNSIGTQSYSFTIARSPAKASVASCLPQGPIGLTMSGAPVFNPYTAQKQNAVEGEFKEEFDSCGGHPDAMGSYHYHYAPPCIDNSKKNEVLGVALDGYPIYGMYDESGKKLSSSDLDECHGRTANGQYQYHVTDDFPYILGCFKGSLHSSIRVSRDCYFAKAEDAGTDTNTDSGSGSARIMSVISSAVIMVIVAVVFN